MQTSYRDIALLACCQALLLVNNAGLIAMNGLVGYALVDNKTFATLGVTSYVLGSALAAMPAALYMARVGRRRGFMTGSLIAIVGSATCALGIAESSFSLYCLGTAIVGVYTAFGLQYRFAAAEVAAPAFKAKAISLVLAGGIVGGFIGPTASRLGKGPAGGAFPRILSRAVGDRVDRHGRAVAGACSRAVRRRTHG